MTYIELDGVIHSTNSLSLLRMCFSVCNPRGSDAEPQEVDSEVWHGLGAEHGHTESASALEGPQLSA